MNELLGPEEMEALLSAGREAAADQDEQADDAPGEASEFDAVALDILGEIGNIAMGSAATVLSKLTQHRVEITTPEAAMLAEGEVPGFPFPHVRVEVTYKDGLEGSNFLVVRAEDAAIIADLMMGGNGRPENEELGEIQISALTEAMNQMMGGASTAMSAFFQTRVDISPAAAAFIQDTDEAHPTTGPAVVIRFSIRIEDLIDSRLVQVVSVPFARDLVARAEAIGRGPEVPDAKSSGPQEMPAQASQGTENGERQVAASAGHGAPGISALQAGESARPDLGNLHIDLIRDIPIEIAAHLGESDLTMQEVLDLAPGSVVELDREEGEAIDILANGVPVARGEVVVVRDQFGIRITEISTPMERMQSLKPRR